MRVDAFGKFRIFLGAVDCCMRSGVHDHVRLKVCDCPFESIWLIEGAAVAIPDPAAQCNEFSQWRQRALQFPTDLAITT